MRRTSLLVENKKVIKDEYGGTRSILNLTQLRYSGKVIHYFKNKTSQMTSTSVAETYYLGLHHKS